MTKIRIHTAGSFSHLNKSQLSKHKKIEDHVYTCTTENTGNGTNMEEDLDFLLSKLG